MRKSKKEFFVIRCSERARGIEKRRRKIMWKRLFVFSKRSFRVFSHLTRCLCCLRRQSPDHALCPGSTDWGLARTVWVRQCRVHCPGLSLVPGLHTGLWLAARLPGSASTVQRPQSRRLTLSWLPGIRGRTGGQAAPASLVVTVNRGRAAPHPGISPSSR